MSDSPPVPDAITGPRFPRPLSLDVYLLGIVDFDSFLTLQERLAEDVASPSGTLGNAWSSRERGVVLVCEHPPLVTLGRSASVTDLAVPEEEFVARGIEIRWLARGGGTILQAPGQLSIATLVSVGEEGRQAVLLRSLIEVALAEVAGEFGVKTETDPRDTSVLVARSGWIARTTLAVREGVSRHGAVLNVSPRMDWQRLVGDTSGPRASCLGAERQRITPISSVREAVVRRLSLRLSEGAYHVHTGHPWLKRTKRLVESV